MKRQSVVGIECCGRPGAELRQEAREVENVKKRNQKYFLAILQFT